MVDLQLKLVATLTLFAANAFRWEDTYFIAFRCQPCKITKLKRILRHGGAMSDKFSFFAAGAASIYKVLAAGPAKVQSARSRSAPKCAV